jgi:hypothetical protein
MLWRVTQDYMQLKVCKNDQIYKVDNAYGNEFKFRKKDKIKRLGVSDW